jgi:hypothetical protein
MPQSLSAEKQFVFLAITVQQFLILIENYSQLDFMPGYMFSHHTVN